MTTRPLACRLTAGGRGAVATIRVHGPATVVDEAGFSPVTGRPLPEHEVDRVVFGRWGAEPAEEVVVCRTGDATVEIHCHGGEAAAARILDDLGRAGCEVVDAGTATERTASLLDRELLETLARATTVRTATLALAQANGLLRTAFEGIVAAFDAEDGSAARARIDDLLAWSRVGLHLATPWRVVFTGRPNVGKSSLVNALLGYTRSIVHDQPGTTRDVVSAETAFDGWPVSLRDTAGLREAGDELETAGIDRARKALAEADLPVVVLDASRPPNDEDRRLVAEWPSALVVAHKCDLPDVWGTAVPAGALRVSSLTHEGIDVLIERIAARLVPAVPSVGQPMPVKPRHVAILADVRLRIASGDLGGARSLAATLVR